jgi:hypothetical protein
MAADVKNQISHYYDQLYLLRQFANVTKTILNIYLIVITNAIISFVTF